MLVQWHGRYDIAVPKGAEFLLLREQHEAPALWFKVDTAAGVHEIRSFIIVGTGKELVVPENNSAKYLGTFFLNKGFFVGHVFELIENGG